VQVAPAELEACAAFTPGDRRRSAYCPSPDEKRGEVTAIGLLSCLTERRQPGQNSTSDYVSEAGLSYKNRRVESSTVDSKSPAGIYFWARGWREMVRQEIRVGEGNF